MGIHRQVAKIAKVDLPTKKPVCLGDLAVNMDVAKKFILTEYMKLNDLKRSAHGLVILAATLATAWAAESAPAEFAPNQPHRPAGFKPAVYPSPKEMRDIYSAETMKRADELMKRVAAVNEQGKYKPTWESLDAHQAPEWWLDAKFGMLIDWGVYSIAAYSPSGYPDWYLNRTMSDTKEYHDKTWGADFKPDDFIQLFTAKDFDAEHLADVARTAGMKYVIPFLKHHDGFCLWDSSFTKRNSMQMGPKRDIAMEWAKASRKRGLKFGFYYSIDDWAYPVIGPDGKTTIRSWSMPPGEDKDKDPAAWTRKFISGKIPVSDFYDQHINPAAIEFFDKYDPDIFWGDGDWNGNATTRKFHQVISYFINHAAGRKEVVFNDRLGECRGVGAGDRVAGTPGVSHGDFYCGENSYEPDRTVAEEYPWEQNSGLSHSFGYNWTETDKDVRSAGDLVTMLVDIVSDGGNLLLITNLTSTGKLDPLMAARLKEVGDWLHVNGEGIYATRRWFQPRQDALRFTRSKDGKQVYVFSTKWPGRTLRVKNLRPVEGSKVTMLGVSEPLRWTVDGDELVVEIPEAVDAKRPCAHVWGFKLEAQPVLEIHASGTEIIPPSTLKAVLRGSNKQLEIRYTMDGSDPVASSPRYTAPLEIGSACRLTARYFKSGTAVGVAVYQDFHLLKSGGDGVMPEVLLESLTPVKLERGWNSGGKDWRKFSCTGGPLSLNGRQYANGIGLHAKAEAVFEIKPEYERFVAGAGVDDAGWAGQVKVAVFGDNQLLLETPVLKGKQAPFNIDVRIPHGVDGRRPAQLRIVVTNAVEGLNSDHTDLVNAGFVVPAKK
jgi:alpha-L-fucosidase